MCNAVTKIGTQCANTVGLADGLCARHRAAAAEPSEPCPVVLARGPRQGEACGAPVFSGGEGKCKRHFAPSVPKGRYVAYAFRYLHPKTPLCGISMGGTTFLACIGPFPSVKKCRSEAIKMFEGPYEEAEVEPDCGVIARLFSSSENLLVRIVPLTTAPKESKEPSLPCVHVMTRGKNEGISCGRPAKKGDLCAKHFQGQKVGGGGVAVEGGCLYLFAKGKNVGLPCGKKVLEGHLKCPKHEEPRHRRAPILEKSPPVAPEAVSPPPSLGGSPVAGAPEAVAFSPSAFEEKFPAPQEAVIPLKKRRAAEKGVLKPDGPLIAHFKDNLEIKVDFSFEAPEDVLEYEFETQELLYVDENYSHFVLQNLENVSAYAPKIVFEAAERILEYLNTERRISKLVYNDAYVQIVTA